jgi:hypothetical protein
VALAQEGPSGLLSSSGSGLHGSEDSPTFSFVGPSVHLQVFCG